MKKASKEDEEKEEEKIDMKNAVKLREIERGKKHLFTTVSFQVLFSFLIHASLPHIFCKTLKKQRWPENVYNSLLTKILTYFNDRTPRCH